MEARQTPPCTGKPEGVTDGAGRGAHPLLYSVCPSAGGVWERAAAGAHGQASVPTRPQPGLARSLCWKTVAPEEPQTTSELLPTRGKQTDQDSGKTAVPLNYLAHRYEKHLHVEAVCMFGYF